LTMLSHPYSNVDNIEYFIVENGGPWHKMPQTKTVTIKKRRSYANQKNLSA